MNYLNIHTDILRGVEFIGAEPVERATWIALLGWCATQENGGVIEGCKDWRDRQWQQLAGVTKDEVETISKLYGFDGENLVVNFYPVEAESAVKAKRESGKKGGRPAKKKEAAKVVNPPKDKGENHMVNHEVNHHRNEKKRKEMEGKEKNTCPPRSDDSDLLKQLWENSPAKSRERSSKKLVAEAWNKVKVSERPDQETLILAIQTWSKCEDWKNGYAKGLHIWINQQRWESLPEIKGEGRKSKILTPDML